MLFFKSEIRSYFYSFSFHLNCRGTITCHEARDFGSIVRKLRVSMQRISANSLSAIACTPLVHRLHALYFI